MQDNMFRYTKAVFLVLSILLLGVGYFVLYTMPTEENGITAPIMARHATEACLMFLGGTISAFICRKPFVVIGTILIVLCGLSFLYMWLGISFSATG